MRVEVNKIIVRLPLLVAAVLFLAVDGCKPCSAAYPFLTKVGSYWVYKGSVEAVAAGPKRIVNEQVILKMEVLSVYKTNQITLQELP